MMTEVARTSFTAISGAVAARPDAFARARYQAANDRYGHYEREPELRPRLRGPVLEAWSEGEDFSVADHRPRAAFAAQLFAQENPGARAHVEDHAGASASYVRAEQRPTQPRNGAALSIDL